MKKVFLLVAMMVAGLAAAYAQQKYHPVPFQLDNAIWYEYYVDNEAYEVKNAKSNYYHYVQFTLDSTDTIISNHKYRNVIFIKNDSVYSTGFFIREDTSNRRVYLKAHAEWLLYDFSANVGDTIGTIMDTFIVQSIDTILIGGIHRKRLNLSCHFSREAILFPNAIGNYQQDVAWLEGIGSTEGLLFPTINYYAGANVLVCYSSNNSIIYHNSHFTDCMPTNTITSPESTPSITAYPNPAKDRITFDFGGARFSTLRLVNAAGVTVLETTLTGQEPQHTLQLKGLPAGIYSCILSGKDGTATQKIVVE